MNMSQASDRAEAKRQCLMTTGSHVDVVHGRCICTLPLFRCVDAFEDIFHGEMGSVLSLLTFSTFFELCTVTYVAMSHLSFYSMFGSNYH